MREGKSKGEIQRERERDPNVVVQEHLTSHKYVNLP